MSHAHNIDNVARTHSLVQWRH